MNKTSLNGKWILTFEGQEKLEVNIPGSVYSALLEAGRIEDPYYRDNELKILPIMENDFIFSRSIMITEDMLKSDALILRFDGIDTLANVYINDHLLGKCENMHRYYEFNLIEEKNKEFVHCGDNELKVYIFSPTKYIKEENAKVYTGGSHECMEGFPHLRKAHCMFGWDWGPRIPDAGIFRDVSLLEIKQSRINSVYISQEHYRDPKDISYTGGALFAPSEVRLHFDIDVENYTSDTDTSVTIVVYAPDGEIYTQAMDEDTVVISEPQLWWPRGYGEQPLYNVEVILSNYKRQPLDCWQKRIGLRTMKMNTQKDEFGEKFAHEVNDVLIFAMGADYIPEDNLLSRVTPQRTRKLLTDAAFANHNCIRVWGGGYYPDDFFYDICDELGILVWQDFMFSCASYELDDSFDENIREEIRQNVRRLRHHASIGLWCGNNEMESQVLDKAWKPSDKQKADYTKIFEYIIPSIVKEEDPDRFYWPSSPSSGGSYDNPWDENRGDAHYWDVWHGEKPFTDYRKYKYRYLSEFGFQSFPNIKTVESFTLPEDRNVFSYVMEMHQRNASANGKILKYISATYLYPKNFDMLLYTSQLLQADAIRYGVEHFRRLRGRCMGAVVWQLNDIWPVASWSSIDYYGRWKALHYAEKRMFAPIMISCEEEGELTQRPFCIEEPHDIKIGAKLHVANETRKEVTGTVNWALRNPDSEIIESGKEKVTVPVLDGVWLSYLDFSKYDVHKVHLEYSFCVGSNVVSENSVLFTPPKHYSFEDPNLSLEVIGDSIRIKADAYAKNVCIEGVDGDVFLSDNYFDMERGEHVVTILNTTATKYTVKSVFDIA